MIRNLNESFFKRCGAYETLNARVKQWQEGMKEEYWVPQFETIKYCWR